MVNQTKSAVVKSYVHLKGISEFRKENRHSNHLMLCKVTSKLPKPGPGVKIPYDFALINIAFCAFQGKQHHQYQFCDSSHWGLTNIEKNFLLFEQILSLTHSYLETHKSVLGKQCRPRSDATLCGV